MVPSPVAGRSRKAAEAPGHSVVIFGLVYAYVVVCGLTSFWLETEGMVLCALLLLLEVAVVAEQVDHRHPSIPWLALTWMATVWMAGILGERTWRVTYSPYLIAQHGRQYSGVDPFDKASVHLDAGVIDFKRNALLDDTLSAGMMLSGTTFCAAPVLGRDAPGQSANGEKGGMPAVQFWAVGTDCCNGRGGFACDDSGEDDAFGGIVWREGRQNYLKAVRAAAALHELPAAEEPILLRWTKYPKRVLQGWLTRSLLSWILSTIAFGMIVSIASFFVDYYFESDVRVGMEDWQPARVQGAHRDRYGSTGRQAPAPRSPRGV